MGDKEFLAGVDMNALAADYQQITGKPFPVPVPTPTPPPAPIADTPTTADKALQAVVGPWANAYARTRPDLVKVQNAYKDWEAAKGF